MNKLITPHYWLRIAREVGKASTCKANVGCVLVHKKMIVGIGYVGSIHGDEHCDEADHINVPAEYRGENGETCIRTVHAEVNAILKCMVRGSHDNGFIECYSTHQPCCECFKLLLQIGVRDIYYITPYADARREEYLKHSAVQNWGYRIGIKQVDIEPVKMKDMKDEIRSELKKCKVIERLLVEEETVNPDVISPSEFEEIVEKMDDLYHD